MNELAERIAVVRGNIAGAAARAGRSAEEISLVAVSKTMPADRVVAAAELGLTDFGENRVQEAETKIPETSLALAPRLASSLHWHLIGHLQSNKARLAVRLFSVVESVDSLSLARTLDRLARERGKPLNVLIEVNVGQEETKFGFADADVPQVFRELRTLEGLNLRGLMTVAPAVLDPEAARPYFRQLRVLRDRLVADNPGSQLPDLSMGMTSDYPVAIEEGATIVRVGRAIFGERQ